MPAAGVPAIGISCAIAPGVLAPTTHAYVIAGVASCAAAGTGEMGAMTENAAIKAARNSVTRRIPRILHGFDNQTGSQGGNRHKRAAVAAATERPRCDTPGEARGGSQAASAVPARAGSWRELRWGTGWD